MGQYLAKIEIVAFFQELLTRVSDFELAGKAEESETLFMGGLKRLPIRFTPSQH
jgi:cytochrome P450